MHFLDNASPSAFTAGETTPRSETALHHAGTADLDLAYAVEAGRGFDALKYAASLLTGTLLLDLTGSDRTVQDRALTEKAREALAEARDHILAARARSDKAQHHRHHLLRALELLSEAAEKGDRSANLIRDRNSDAVFGMIRGAWSELGRLDKLLSGFHTVDFSQSCCAFHARQMAQYSRT